MARRNLIDAIKSDNLLVDFLVAHRGKENVVSSSEIAEYLTNCGFPINAVSAGVKVKRVMVERHLPICHFNTHGYYWASNKAELRESILDLENRIEAMQERIKHLKGFIID